MLQILMAGTALVSAGLDLNRGVDPRVLADALAAPESRRAAGEGARFCVVDSGQHLIGRGQRPQAGRRICRTRREWVTLGVQPITG